MSGKRARRLQLIGFVVLTAAFLGHAPIHRLHAQPPRGQELYQDFRGSKPLTDEWKMIGQNREAIINPEAQGLRITIPKTSRSTQPVGVRLMFPASGDFDITAAYQIVAMDAPPAGASGVGVAFNLVAQNNYKKFVRFGRFIFPPEGHVYIAECRLKDEPDKYQSRTVKTEARAGKIRLVREGANLRYLVADDPPDVFREIHNGVFTDDDLEIVRLGVNNNASPAGVDVRLVDIRVRFGKQSADQPGGGDHPVEADVKPPSRAWLAVGLLIGSALVLIFAALAVFLVMQLRRRPSAAPAAVEFADGADPPAPSVSCPDCGKKLKGKAGSAGKKIRCSQCGAPIAPTE
jgi:hypothetical protein